MTSAQRARNGRAWGTGARAAAVAAPPGVRGQERPEPRATVAPPAGPVAVRAAAAAPADTTRPRAIEYSDACTTRLTIRRVGSYAMLPLFAAWLWRQ